MEKASEKAGKSPRMVITDKLAAYLDGIELAFGADTKHVQSKPFTVENSTNLIERFHGTLKSRTKVMRGLKKRESAELFTKGWLIHYNYFRPHESLGDKTPAEAAGVKFPYRNWKDVIREPEMVVRRIEVSEEPIKIKPRLTVSLVDKPTNVRQTSKRRKPRGDIYEGRGMISRHPFAGGKAKRGRLL